MVCTPFSQHSKTHEASLPLIWIFTGKAGLSKGHLLQTTKQNKTKQFNTLSESRYNSQGSELFQIYMTYQLLEQFLWRHMKSHSVNNLKTDKRTGQILFKITLSSCKVNFFDKKQQKSTIYIKIVKHLSSTVFGTFIICSISAVVLFIFWVLLTRRWSCSQYRENGLQDWAQELLLQHSL